MPSHKSRSKDDTWTTEELDNALKDDREKQRIERREKRERKDKSKTRKGGERHEQGSRKENVSDNVDTKKVRVKDDDKKTVTVSRDRETEREERRRKRATEEQSSSRQRPAKDEDSNRKEKRERNRTHDTDTTDRNRSSRHTDVNESRSDRNRSSRHTDVNESRSDRNRSSRHTDVNESRSKRSDRHKDNNEKRKDDKYRNRETNEDEPKRDRHKNRVEDSNDDKHRKKREHKDRRDDKSESKHQETESNDSKQNGKHSPEENEYNYDDEEFEDYEEDFEEDDSDDQEEEKPGLNMGGREMSDLLKALDEENARLASGSTKSNYSDSPDQYNEKYNNKDQETQPNIARGRTFINFVTAKQRAVDQKVSNKTKKRSQDLLKLIEFDKAGFDMFDLPPVKEYELYIRSFGRTDTKQAYVQTNEDNLDRDIQTEEIEYRDKWTQHPAEDLLGYGGDDIEPVKSSSGINLNEDLSRMSNFVSRAAQVMGVLLSEEDKAVDNSATKGNKSSISVSDGFTQLGSPVILQDRCVTFACYSPSQTDMLLTCYSSNVQDTADKQKGIICVWNVMDPLKPQKYLTCESQPQCCCFSPVKASLVCAGMTDGSIAIWDLREQAYMHHLVVYGQEEFLLRYPTYSTAGVCDSENHHSPVKSLVPVFPDPTSPQYKEELSDTVSGLSFQLASVEENAVVNLWVVAEIPTTDMAGSEIDLGLSPGGKIKLVKSSSVQLLTPLKFGGKDDLQAYEFQLSSHDLNHFYVGTDTGYIIHGIRFGTSAFPRGYTSVINNHIKVQTIDFSPFGYPYFLSGCSDGSVHLYHTSLENPLASWNNLSSDGQSNSILCVRWSRSRPGVFFVLDDQSKLYSFDLIEGESSPVNTDHIATGKVVYMALSNDNRVIGGTQSTKSQQLLLTFENGSTELHALNRNFTEQKTLEHEFMKKYNDRF